jgi:hypothetical protein
MPFPPRYLSPEELTALLLWWWRVCEEAAAAVAAPLVPASAARRGALDVALMVGRLLSSACGMVRGALAAAVGNCAVDPLVPVPLDGNTNSRPPVNVDSMVLNTQLQSLNDCLRKNEGTHLTGLPNA